MSTLASRVEAAQKLWLSWSEEKRGSIVLEGADRTLEGIKIKQLENEVAALKEQLISAENSLKHARAEATHWRKNHANEVARARLLKERTDVPLERVLAYKLVGEYERRLANEEKPRITHVALKFKTGLIMTMPAPYRHHHIFNNTQVTIPSHMADHEQGFLVSGKLKFVGRAEARAIAVEAGQCINPTHNSLLFSEDIW